MMNMPYLRLCLLALFIAEGWTKYSFKNVECIAVDPNFLRFPRCLIKAVNRTYKYLTVETHFLKVPVKDITLQVYYEKRANGYRPFPINITFDVCKFLKTSDKDPVKRFIFSFFAQHSNINHSCPYDHNIIVDKLDMAFVSENSKHLPFPAGDYRFFTSWRNYGVERAQVVVYGHMD